MACIFKALDQTMNLRNVEWDCKTYVMRSMTLCDGRLPSSSRACQKKKSETNTAAILSSTYKGIGVDHFIEKLSHRDLEFAMALRGYNINGREMILTHRTVPLNSMDCGIPLSTTLAPRKGLG